MENKPKTRYPIRLERSYGNNLAKSIVQIGEVALYEFDKMLAKDIDKDSFKKDQQFIQDGLLDVAKRLIKKVKIITLGGLGNSDAKKSATKYLNGVSSFNKANVNSQLSAKGINPLESELWLKSYVNTKIAENVSYITNIRDEYTTKFEQIIYRGVTSGQSSKEMRNELVNLLRVSEERARFIARDQTGTILGQLNAKRQQKAGFPAFRWSDSGDEKVRASHSERNGKIYYYADNPLLPGEDYGCRCVAEPVDEEELETEKHEFGLTPNEEHAMKKYVSSDAYIINDKLRNGYELNQNDKDFINRLDIALEKLPKYKGDLTRSYEFRSFEDAAKFANSFKIGDEKEFKEYFSTTSSIYNEQDQVRFVIINTKKGLDLGSFNHNEREILFKRDSKFRVVDRYLTDGKPYIVMEEI